MKTKQYYAELTEKLIEQLESNPTGWTSSWSSVGSIPRNAETGKMYRGANIFWLFVTGADRGYSSTAWATYKAWKRIGGQVRKGEKGTTAVFWKPIIVENEETGKKEKRFIFRSYTVFNLAQVDQAEEGVEIKLHAKCMDVELRDTDGIAEAAAWFADTGARIDSAAGNSPCYIPSQDRIEMPLIEQFDTDEAYYGTLAHEVTHWTGAKTRLDRDHSGKFGDYSYAIEELVAEMGSVFISALLGLEHEPREDHAQYINHWLQVARENETAVYRAAVDAAKGLEFCVDAVAAARGEIEDNVAEQAA